VAPLLADTHRLYMVDLRGHGWSDAPADGYDKEQLATDVLGVMDQLGLDEVGLIGHDWGGWIGFLAALRAPTRITGLLALGIVPPFQRPDLRKALAAWRGAYQVLLSTPVLAEAMLRASPRLVETAIRSSSTVADAFDPDDLRSYGEVLQEPARARASSSLYRTFLLHELPRLGRYRSQRLSVPTRLVVGEHDPVARPPFLGDWMDHADDMRVDVVPGVGHFVPEEAPQLVAEIAREHFG